MTATAETPVDPALERVKTGVEAFDDLVMGGLPRGRTTIVGGTPGCGKTVFATQFLAHGITELGEPGVFVTFEETPAEIEVFLGLIRSGTLAATVEALPMTDLRVMSLVHALLVKRVFETEESSSLLEQTNIITRH